MIRKSISIDEEADGVIKKFGGKNVSKFLRDLLKGKISIKREYEVNKDSKGEISLKKKYEMNKE